MGDVQSKDNRREQHTAKGEGGGALKSLNHTEGYRRARL